MVVRYESEKSVPDGLKIALTCSPGLPFESDLKNSTFSTVTGLSYYSYTCISYKRISSFDEQQPIDILINKYKIKLIY